MSGQIYFYTAGFELFGRYHGHLATLESSASLSIQLDRVLAGLIDIETKWRSSVVSERF